MIVLIVLTFVRVKKKLRYLKKICYGSCCVTWNDKSFQYYPDLVINISISHRPEVKKESSGELDELMQVDGIKFSSIELAP